VNNDPVNYVDLWGLEELYSESLVDFVKQAEGFSPTLYDDRRPQSGPITDLSTVVGTPTIGYGHTRTATEYLGRTITEQEADTLLRNDLTYAAGVFTNPANNYPSVSSLNQNELDALIDYAFHSGRTGMISTIGGAVRDLLTDNIPGIITDSNRNYFIESFTQNTTGGELNRRLNQAQLFLTGDYNGDPTDPGRFSICDGYQN
jgi:GH24 family phage-related lysozyme (muramidase)